MLVFMFELSVKISSLIIDVRTKVKAPVSERIQDPPKIENPISLMFYWLF